MSKTIEIPDIAQWEETDSILAKNTIGRLTNEVRSAYDGDGKLLGTGLAIEEKSSSTLNNLNFLENAETSSCGRCLGFLGLGIDTAIASAEEMKSVEQQELKRNLDLLVQIRKLMTQKKLTPDVVYNEFNKKSDEMSEEELQEVIVWLENK